MQLDKNVLYKMKYLVTPNHEGDTKDEVGERTEENEPGRAS